MVIDMKRIDEIVNSEDFQEFSKIIEPIVNDGLSGLKKLAGHDQAELTDQEIKAARFILQVKEWGYRRAQEILN